MAAVTSSGLWPATDLTYLSAPVYARVTPRQAVGVSPSAARWLFPAVTSVPVASAFTRYPAQP